VLGDARYRDFVLRFRQYTPAKKEDEISGFFGAVLDIMRQELQEKDEATKQMQQTEVCCAKLFSLLQERALPKQVVRGLSNVKQHLVAQQFDEANQIYFSLTIGNAPWPSSDSTSLDTEKLPILQAVKRLMTFFEEKIAPPFFSVDRKLLDQQEIAIAKSKAKAEESVELLHSPE